MNVLMVDDEKKITNVLMSYFKSDGHNTFVAHTGEDALHIINNHPLDMIILDLMLKDMPGEEICKYVKRYMDIPIIMLTAKISIDDKIAGFQLGCDDYVIKPFHPKEIVVRAKRLLPNAKKNQVMHFGKLWLYKETRQIIFKDKSVSVTPHEFEMILLFMENPKKVFTREMMIERIFGLDIEMNVRTVDQHIKNIRKKLGANTIQTVFGLGYKLNEAGILQ